MKNQLYLIYLLSYSLLEHQNYIKLIAVRNNYTICQSLLHSHVSYLFLCFQKNGLSFLTAEDPDIFCIQETKCTVAKLPAELKKVAGYKTYWLSGDKEGYSGSALFSKKEPIKVSYGISKLHSLFVSGSFVSML